MAERDELDELRAAWRALTPPDPHAAGPDAAERAAIEWMRSAWATLDAPPAAPPIWLRHRRVLRALPFAAALAAAASLLALLLFVPREEPAREPALAEATPVKPGTEDPPAPTQLAALDRADGGLELRHGSVRLILLLPDESGTSDVR